MWHKVGMLSRQGSIAEHVKLRAGTKIFIVYAYNIESPLAHWWQSPQVFAQHLGDLAAFVPVHGGLRGLHIARRSCLNFNKTKHIRIPADQVDFPTATRRAEIARHHHITRLPQ